MDKTDDASSLQEQLSTVDEQIIVLENEVSKLKSDLVAAELWWVPGFLLILVLIVVAYKLLVKRKKI